MNDQLKKLAPTLLESAEEFGTPVYVYDGEKILSQYKRLVHAFDGIRFRVHYACKANTNINILKLLRSAGCELDTVSEQEVQLGLYAGYKPEQIIYTPNNVAIAELEKVVKLGTYINIDSLPALENFGELYGSSVPVCLRLNPNILAGGNHKIQTGHAGSKFGISIKQMSQIHAIVNKHNIIVEGLHIHNGSDILDIDAFFKGFDVLIQSGMAFKDLRYIDFGGGFKVAYKENDIVTDVEHLGPQVVERFKAFCQAFGRELELWCEPGKFLVSEAGYLLAKVNVVKDTGTTVFAGLDTGLNHLIRPMMYDAYHQIENISNLEGEPKVYSVVGNICETDTFGTDRNISEIHEGDILAMLNAGAYGYSMSSNYNSRFRPAEVLLLNGQKRLIRKREEMEDLLRNQIVIE